MTFVEIDDGSADTRRISVSARHEAVLADGRHLLLLDDRGWSWGAPLTSFSMEEVPDGDSRPEEMPDLWSGVSVEDIEETARVVVGPDEPPDGSSREDMEGAHWEYLSRVLQTQGVVLGASDLKRLPHDVVLSERLLARVSR